LSSKFHGYIVEASKLLKTWKSLYQCTWYENSKLNGGMDLIKSSVNKV